MNRRAVWYAATLAMLGGAPPAAAQLVSEREVEALSGCYEVEIGVWNPSPPEDAASLPARLKLLAGMHHASPPDPAPTLRAHPRSLPTILRRATAWNAGGQPIRGFDAWTATNHRTISLRQRIEGPYVLTAWRREEGDGFGGRIFTAGSLRLRDLPSEEFRSAPVTLHPEACEARRRAHGRWRPASDAEGLRGAEVRAIEVSSDGALWLALRERGVVRIEDGEAAWFGTGDGLVSEGVADLYEDRAGRMWAAGQGGVSILEDGAWAAHPALGTLEPNVVFDIHEAAATGAIWAASSGGAAYWTPPGWQLPELVDELPHPVVHSVVVDREGVVWLACRRGLARVEDGAVTTYFLEVNFRSADIAPDGTLWFGTPHGIYTWDGASWGRHRAGRPTYPILASQGSTVWAGTPGAGLLLRYEDGHRDEIDLPEHLRGAEIFDLAVAPDGSVWVATARGAARFEPVPRLPPF